MAGKKECLISVDVETSGPIPGDYSMLSLGACVVGGKD
jgi:ribonuclease T